MNIKIRPDIDKNVTHIDYRVLDFTNTDTTTSLIDCVRELLQNSWDAFIGRNEKNNGEKFKFKITLNKLDKGIFPFKEYKDYLKESNDFYSEIIDRDGNDKDKHCKKINDSFYKIVNDNEMCYLNIEDNSGGLDGTTMYTSKKHGSKALLQHDMSVKPNNNSIGTYGKGKYTAILLSPIRTVFYINQRKNKKYFVGLSEINSFPFSNDNGIEKFKGKHFFWGKPNKENNCDWIELDETNNNIKNLRNLNSDGLSTIILSKMINSDWMNECAYSIISSFFTIIEDERVEISIEDRTQSKSNFFTIKNHEDVVSTFRDIKKSTFYTENNKNIKEEFDKIESFVLNQNSEEYRKEFVLKVGDKKIKYDIKLKLFNSGEEEDGIKKDYFNFVREGMLLRKQNMLISNIPYTNNLKFYGYLFSNNIDLNRILSQFEPPSHDQFITGIHGDNLPEGLPKSRILAAFLNEIKRWTYDKIDEKCYPNTNSNQKTTWMFQGQNNKGQGNELEQPSYTRNYKLRENDFKIINTTSTSLLTEGEVLFLNKNGETKTHKLDPNGDYIEYVRRRPKNRRPGPPNPNINPPAEKRRVNINKPNQPAEARTGLVNPKNFRSKLIKKEKNITNYTINFEDVDFSDIDILRIKQQSLGTTKVTSFKIEKAFLNGHRINKILEIKKDRNQPIVFAYDLKIDQIHKTNKSNSNLKLEIEELNSTFSSFELSIHN